MSRMRILSLLVVTSAALAACGCFGGGKGGGRSASKGGRFEGKNSPPPKGRGKNQNQNHMASLDELSPEGSMQRDLARLREHEKEQVKVLNEMRTALGKGEDMIAKEEEKLREIRTQIARYDSAMRTHEMARGYDRSRSGGAVPATMYADRGREDAGRDNYGRYDRPMYDDRRAPARSQQSERVSYDRREAPPRSQGYDRYDRPSPRDSYGRNDSYGREEVLYDPQAARRSSAPARAPSGYGEQRRELPPSGQSRNSGEWVPPGGDRLFSDAAPRQAPVNNTLRPARRVQEAPEPVSVPAAGASVQSRPPARQAEPPVRPAAAASAADDDDDVFTPDLYLSGGY